MININEAAEDLKILFMGTPEFSRVSLEYMIKNKFNVIGVITQTDKPTGRKMTLSPSAVKKYALGENIPVYQPQTLKNDEFFDLLKKIAPDIIVVAAYGKILPKNVINYPKYGCINVHASLLPKYRGAAPINAAIMNGEKTTGITIIHMDEGIDTGDMILKESVEIGENETFGELHDRLAQVGGKILCEALRQIADGTAKREKQPIDGVIYVGKIDDSMCKIDWNTPPKAVHDKIRGLSPSPAAFTWLNGKKLKIYKSKVSDDSFTGEYKIGEVVNAAKSIGIKTSGGVIEVLELQIEGAKKMTASDFINGRKISKGMIFNEK